MAEPPARGKNGSETVANPPTPAQRLVVVVVLHSQQQSCVLFSTEDVGNMQYHKRRLLTNFVRSQVWAHCAVS